MAPRQTFDFGECIVDALSIETASTLEECFLVTKIADARAPACDDDRVWYEVVPSVDEITADGRHACKRTDTGIISAGGASRSEVGEKTGSRVFARASEYGIRVLRSLYGQGCDMQTSKADEAPPPSIFIGNRVSAPGTDDIDLDRDNIWLVVEVKWLNVFVDNHRLIGGNEICSESGQPERREEGVFYGAKERARCFGQGGENELYERLQM